MDVPLLLGEFGMYWRTITKWGGNFRAKTLVLLNGTLFKWLGIDGIDETYKNYIMFALLIMVRIMIIKLICAVCCKKKAP